MLSEGAVKELSEIRRSPWIGSVWKKKTYLSFGFEEKPELCREDEEIPAVLKL